MKKLLHAPIYPRVHIAIYCYGVGRYIRTIPDNSCLDYWSITMSNLNAKIKTPAQVLGVATPENQDNAGRHDDLELSHSERVAFVVVKMTALIVASDNQTGQSEAIKKD